MEPFTRAPASLLSSLQACGARVVSAGLALVCLLTLLPMNPASAVAAVDDSNIPGVPMARQWVGSLNVLSDWTDVYRVWLEAGEQIDVSSTNDPANRFWLYLYGPDATDVLLDPALDKSENPGPSQSVTWTAVTSGWHYLRVIQWAGSGDYFVWTTRRLTGPPVPDTPERIAGPDRYTTAVLIAVKNFPGWKNCKHVVIASGEDRAAADPLAAAGLTWTYGAPILLVQADKVPSSVMIALRAIAEANEGVEIHVVGGTATIPQARLNEIAAQVPGATFDRIGPAANRFELAASIARRMDEERPQEFLVGSEKRQVLIANGADPEKFFDPLALSAVSARSGFPILLVNENSIPRQTASALTDLDLGRRIIGGGPATVSDGVYAELAASGQPVARWSGADRYATARVIAEEAYPWVLQPHNTGVAAKLPDALAGGAFVGLRGGPILITDGQSLSSAPRGFLAANTDEISEAWALGGPVSLTNTTMNQMGQALAP
jgi:putative cell wall-binding protein